MFQFIKFCLIGGIGFLVDATILTLLVSFSVNIVASRLASFLVAVSVTWLLNRLWTFSNVTHTSSTNKQYISYFLGQTIGALINLGVFFSVIYMYPDIIKYPVIPLGAGAAVALVFNFTYSKLFVFASKRNERN